MPGNLPHPRSSCVTCRVLGWGKLSTLQQWWLYNFGEEPVDYVSFKAFLRWVLFTSWALVNVLIQTKELWDTCICGPRCVFKSQERNWVNGEWVTHLQGCMCWQAVLGAQIALLAFSTCCLPLLSICWKPPWFARHPHTAGRMDSQGRSNHSHSQFLRITCSSLFVCFSFLSFMVRVHFFEL